MTPAARKAALAAIAVRFKRKEITRAAMEREVDRVMGQDQEPDREAERLFEENRRQ